MKKKVRSGSVVLTCLLFSQAFLPLAEVVAAPTQTSAKTEVSAVKTTGSKTLNSTVRNSLQDEIKTVSSTTTVDDSEKTNALNAEKAAKDAKDAEAEAKDKDKDKDKDKKKENLIPVQMLGVNDFHGALNTTGTAYLGADKFPGSGKASKLATNLDIAQSQFSVATNSSNSTRIQAGDLVGASPANSALLADEPTMKVFKEMNFEIGTLGNHEFDKGLGEFKRILDGRKPEVGQFEGPLAEIMANYPRVASTQEIVIGNLVNKSDNAIPHGFQPYTTKTYSGKDGKSVKVGYIGVITSEFTNLVLAQHTQDYNVLDEAETIAKYSKELRDQGVNAIAVVSHIAATSSGDTVGGEIVPILDKVNTLDPDNSVDLVFAAHNHQYTNGVYTNGKNKTRVVQSTAQGKAYADVQGELDPETQDFAEVPDAKIKPTNEGVENPVVQATVDHASQTIKAITDSKVGQVDMKNVKDGKVSREASADNESQVGNLITDAQLYMANESKLTDAQGNPVKVDFAMTNTGGIRADLAVDDKGNVTWGAAQAVQPFGNILQVVSLTGQNIIDVLGQQFNGSTGYSLQFAGLKYTYTGDPKGKENNLKIEKVTDEKGKEIDPAKTYNVIINDFLFGGGDGFKKFTEGTLVTAMDTDTNTFVDYFAAMEKAGKKVIVPELNRKAKAKTTSGDVIPIQMLGVNDFHGAIDTSGTAYLEGVKHTGVGKASNLAAHLNGAETEFKAKQTDGNTERIQAGDLVGASPANSALLRDEPTMRVFNQMNFTIGTLGNHEFDKGLGEFKRILDGRKPTREELGNVSDSLWNAISTYPREKSKQEIVISNIENKSTGKYGNKGDIPLGFKPYTIKEYGQGDKKVKVGYIGVITNEFPNLVLAEHTKDFNVIDEAEAISKYSKVLREKEDVNAIVLVTHIAATSKDGKVANEIVPIMDKVEKLDPKNSIDVIFTGHNHQFTNGVIERKDKPGIRVVQSTAQGKAYIDVQGELDTKTKDFKETPKAEVKPTTALPEAQQDAGVKEIIEHANETIKPLTSATLATADLNKVSVDDKGNPIISRQTNVHGESEVGNLITDAQLYMAKNTNLKDAAGKKVDVDFAFTNNGGIRADLLIEPVTGRITWGAVQAVQPFGNILQVVAMKGKDVKAVLNEQYANGNTGYSLQVSGLTYTYTGSPEKGIKIATVKDASGKELKDDATYNIVINDFLFGGGDGFKSFTKSKLVTAMDTDTETFVSYFEKQAAQNKLIESPKLDRKSLKDETTTTTTDPTSTTNTSTDTSGSGTNSSSKPKPTGEKEQKLRKASIVNPIHAGDKVIKGKTLAGAKVSYRVRAKDGKLSITSKEVIANAKGEFEIPVTGNLVVGDTVLVNIMHDGVKIELSQKVTAKKATGNGTNTNGGKPGSVLPQTGETENYLGLAGFALIGFVVILRRRKVS